MVPTVVLFLTEQFNCIPSKCVIIFVLSFADCLVGHPKDAFIASSFTWRWILSSVSMENIYAPGIQAYVCGVCCQKENMKIHNSCAEFFLSQRAFENIWQNQIPPLCSWEEEKDVLSLCAL